MDKSLAGKAALVTGAGRGIGAGIARAFARHGAHVYCAGRTEEDLRTVADAIRTEGGQADAIATDIADPESVRALYERIGGRSEVLDILVANAGFVPPGGAQAIDAATWRRVVEVNLFGSYDSIRLAVPLMRKRRGGKVIVVGSGAGRQPVPGMSSYCCSKAGLSMLVKVMAQELNEHGISINELIPGPVITERNRGQSGAAINNPALKSMEWVKEPDDVAPLALFLAAQPDEGGPTGQTFSLARRPL